MAAAGRREVRDIVDVVTVHETILPLGAVIWAAVDIIMAKLRAALDDAEAFVSRMATDMTGLLFLQGGKAVQPDPALLEHYETHRGQLRGHWPASGEIRAAMLERYNA